MVGISRSACGTALLALAGVLSACTATATGTVPEVGRAALQDDIAARLTQAGETPASVTCREDLLGEKKGRTARCDVVISDTNIFQPIVTVTAVDGERVDYELTPTLSQDQLEQAVRRLAADSGEPVTAVACESGLEGAVGARAYCDVTSDGGPARRAVEVVDVTGLTMNFNLLSS